MCQRSDVRSQTMQLLKETRGNTSIPKYRANKILDSIDNKHKVRQMGSGHIINCLYSQGNDQQMTNPMRKVSANFTWQEANTQDL